MTERNQETYGGVFEVEEKESQPGDHMLYALKLILYFRRSIFDISLIISNRFPRPSPFPTHTHTNTSPPQKKKKDIKLYKNTYLLCNTTKSLKMRFNVLFLSSERCHLSWAIGFFAICVTDINLLRSISICGQCLHCTPYIISFHHSEQRPTYFFRCKYSFAFRLLNQESGIPLCVWKKRHDLANVFGVFTGARHQINNYEIQ